MNYAEMIFGDMIDAANAYNQFKNAQYKLLNDFSIGFWVIDGEEHHCMLLDGEVYHRKSDHKILPDEMHKFLSRVGDFFEFKKMFHDGRIKVSPAKMNPKDPRSELQAKMLAEIV